MKEDWVMATSNDTPRRGQKHGMYGTPTYNSWWAMKQRCTYPKHVEYHRYGARGVQLCPEWLEFSGFFADMGERPSVAHSIDRIDSAGHYEPKNCRWATKREQANNCSKNRLVTAQGLTLTLAEWERRTGVNQYALRKRLVRGWPPERAVSEPVLGSRSRQQV
jgi:hypothetical protein